MAGAGVAAAVAPAGPGRFAAADAAWRALLDDAVIDDAGAADAAANAAAGAPDAGPMLLGGFGFDPDGPRAARWRGFPAARLVLPRVQLVAAGGAHWFTANVVVGPDGDPGDASGDPLGDPLGAAFGGGAGGVAEAVRLAYALTAGGAPGASAASGARAGGVCLADEVPAAGWRALVADAVSAIRGGALEKVVVARAVRAVAPDAFDVVAALRALRARYPDCYVFGYWAEGGAADGAADRAAFVGASPERLVRVDGERVRATSLAGSAPRGPGDDGGAALLASAKDRAEHAIVRGALVGALGELCDGVEAATEPSVRALANVYHLQTDVRGRLRAGRSVFDLVARLHPTPAVGGSPRPAALRFLAEREGLDRGWYAGPVGWVGRAGGEFAVALRSGLVRGAEAWLFAGCGIVADSDPAREYDESRAKLRAMEQALAAATSGAASGAASD